MARRATFTLQGYDRVTRMLRRVEGAAADDKLRDLLYEKGAVTIRDEQRRRAPKGRTGRLVRAIVAKKGTRAPVAWAAVDLKEFDKDEAGYPFILEYGSDEHEISAKDGGDLYFGGQWVHSVEHPGIKPIRYFRDGLRNARPRARKQILLGMSDLIRQAIISESA